VDQDWALAPLAFVVRVVGGLMVAVTLFVVPFVIFGSGSFLGVGADEVCVESPLAGWSSDGDAGMRAVVEPARGVSVSATTIRLCDGSPSGGQRTLSLVEQGSGFVYAAGLLLLLSLLLRTARQGFFVPRIALAVGRLGLYVLLGGLAAAFLHAWAASRLAATMVDGELAHPGLVATLHGLAAPLLAGFGLLTIGRVLVHAVPMQRELDTTV